MIKYIDRITGKETEEKVYGEKILHFLYEKNQPLNSLIGTPFAHFLSRNAWISAAYGYWQKCGITKSKIKPFIDKFQVDPSEFLNPVEEFCSFNDFFIRKLKPDARPMAGTEAVIPADGRYRFFPNISQTDGFVVKGKKFNLAELLQDSVLAQRYENGSLVMARLCPSDYHRFHFPFDCIPEESKLINGWLYSVNPIAIEQNINIFTENKRSLCSLNSELFGKVLFLEIGATNVGSINQTYKPNSIQLKGAEKGYFAFGGSALILLFEPGRIQFAEDLIKLSRYGKEIRCLLGQPLS